MIFYRDQELIANIEFLTINKRDLLNQIVHPIIIDQLIEEGSID